MKTRRQQFPPAYFVLMCGLSPIALCFVAIQMQQNSTVTDVFVVVPLSGTSAASAGEGSASTGG